MAIVQGIIMTNRKYLDFNRYLTNNSEVDLKVNLKSVWKHILKLILISIGFLICYFLVKYLGIILPELTLALIENDYSLMYAAIFAIAALFITSITTLLMVVNVFILE